jgi:hypothetical protein
MDLAAVAAKLYALVPAEFTAERNREAKAARSEGNSLLAKQIGRLQKPSTAAWAVNMLALRRAEEIAQVLELGESLRRAQEELDPASLRQLGQQRQKLLGAVVRDGRAVARELGVAVSDATATEMEQTLRAAMADPDAAAAVRSGQLVRTLSSNGIEPVDLTGAVAVPGALPAAADDGGAWPRAGRPPVRAAAEFDERDVSGQKEVVEARRRAEEERRRQRDEAKAELEEAERAVEQAETELADAEQHLSEVSTRKSELARELKELHSRMAELEEELASVDREAGYAERTRRLAARLAEQERQVARRAQERLERL